MIVVLCHRPGKPVGKLEFFELPERPSDDEIAQSCERKWKDGELVQVEPDSCKWKYEWRVSG